MSTQLTDHGTHWTVATVSKRGKQKRMARGAVRVGKSDPKALGDEIIRQAIAIRKQFGIDQPA